MRKLIFTLILLMVIVSKPSFANRPINAEVFNEPKISYTFQKKILDYEDDALIKLIDDKYADLSMRVESFIRYIDTKNYSKDAKVKRFMVFDYYLIDGELVTIESHMIERPSFETLYALPYQIELEYYFGKTGPVNYVEAIKKTKIFQDGTIPEWALKSLYPKYISPIMLGLTESQIDKYSGIIPGTEISMVDALKNQNNQVTKGQFIGLFLELLNEISLGYNFTGYEPVGDYLGVMYLNTDLDLYVAIDFRDLTLPTPFSEFYAREKTVYHCKDISEYTNLAFTLAYQKKIVNGRTAKNEYGDTLLYSDIDKSLTRAQAAAMFTNYLEKAGLSMKESEQKVSMIKDIKSTDWYYKHLVTMNNYGVITPNYLGNIRPNDKVTFAEALAMIMKFTELLK